MDANAIIVVELVYCGIIPESVEVKISRTANSE